MPGLWTRNMPAGRHGILFFGLALACAGCAVRAYAQEPAPAPAEPTAPNPAPQYPGSSGYDFENSDANSLAFVNSNANSVRYVDRSHGPLNIGLEFRTSYADNVFDSPQQTQSGVYFLAGAPISYIHGTNQSRFVANYRVDGAIYPSYSEINSVSQVYLHRYERNTSEVTSFYWDFTAGRVSSLGQYLPALIPVGGTGVVPPSVGTAVLENSYTVSNVVTSFGVNHKFSEKDSISASATGGWLEEAQDKPAAGVPRQILRDEPLGGNVKWEHLVRPTTAIGAELTDLYVRGLAPVGHENYTAVEGTFRYNWTQYLSMRAAAGPLFNVSNSTTAAGNSHNLTYAVNAGISYSTIFARISGEYSRVIQLQYLAAPTPAQQISAVFDRSISRTMDLTVDARFVHSDAGPSVVSQTNYGLTGRVDRYITRNFSIFITAARFSLSSPPSNGTPLSYGRDEVAGGIHYSIGEPLEREGPRP